MATKYQKGKIYKILNNKTDKIYIGSTTSALSQRLAQHKVKHKKYLKGEEVTLHVTT